MSTRIQIRSLVKVFGKGQAAARAVDGIDLDIEPGELFFLLGPSGCGKTTLLRMIAGFIDPTAGSIRFNDKDVTHAPPNARNTGMVFQSYALWPHMTVEANVAFGLKVRKIGEPERSKRVMEALKAVQMDAYASRKPTQLSGGQQQRVALARAIVVRPDVLLLDEPLSNLDAKLRIELRSEIRRICKSSGITTVYVTHDQKEALSMADRVAIIRAGKVEQLGTPAELYRRPRDTFVAEFLGETNFVPGVAKPAGASILVETSAGALTADKTEHAPTTGQVICSLRPESVRLVPPGTPGALDAKRLETTYLGETAQHLVELKGGVRLKVAELNPAEIRAAADEPVAVAVYPQDVVVLAKHE
ncbi:MAG: ABC transporter ATP-binding protein [Phycisphaerales bacterium JB059]